MPQTYVPQLQMYTRVRQWTSMHQRVAGPWSVRPLTGPLVFLRVWAIDYGREFAGWLDTGELWVLLFGGRGGA
ncbi:hypothetical protein CEXT_573341 [Caerostris extrusa]|uniref:Uncharacterized protein n=1 Tax=Caerostris extrusa TaxID=172846 RepID=A0AAV4XW79_CAEEX|nr:hypothetical protein CEXT_573341 [Caerostris extrusa]